MAVTTAFGRQQVVPKPRNRLLDSGERRPERQDQPGGEDDPEPTREMEALVKVVSELHKQWGGLAEEARGAAGKPGSEKVWVRPPPYAPQDGTEREGEGRGEDASGRNREEVLDLTNARKWEGEENEKEKSFGGDREGGRSTSEGQRANQNIHLKKGLCRASTSPSRRWGEPRGRERPTRKGSGQAWNLTKRYWNPEVTSQLSSGSRSDTDPNSEKEEEMGTDRVKSKNIPIRNKAEP
ncbi:uncharacterized protein LOC118159468 [Oxyura jamaicensis]|uniref:uncharacterized protein LOC118159468 n=1 Tax=Oxyura jamaicensis TaxID=8884 RepID=UPI0015A5207C|nr:uncharacterized protein LOC118159468 [Oxyura jamaicensis]